MAQLYLVFGFFVYADPLTSTSSQDHRNEHMRILVDVDWRGSDTPSRSNPHNRMVEPHRVKPRTNRRVSCALNISRAYLKIELGTAMVVLPRVALQPARGEDVRPIIAMSVALL